MKKKMKLTLADTVFNGCPIVAVSANPNNGSAIGKYEGYAESSVQEY